ncbi:hypothetical protein JCGZ_21826 [Jatropha curcas]|uniref:Signal recognition particle 9 kDa protein n=1 Tax=Jatropha curcas TaxID=180498 RepID=A0A067JMW4_JATCU|nr:hypothetical protein JCGZ_21826 [Jatropha curcas]
MMILDICGLVVAVLVVANSDNCCCNGVDSDWDDKVMVVYIRVVCLKFKTDQAQDARKMEKLNNIFFTLMSRGPDADISEVTGKEQTESQPGKKGRGRKQ